MEKGKIKKIKIFVEKNFPPQIVQKADCIVDCGLKGDRFAKGGEKQLTAIDSQSLEWMEAQTEKGLCFNRYKANLEVENMDLSALKSGEKLVCGTSQLEISQTGKECFAECVLVQGKKPCMLRSHAKYIKVVESGIIKVDDELYKKQ